MKKINVKSPAGITASIMLLYLIQWGAQYIGYNYLPIYIDSLPFATNSTTGLAIAVGAATTICVQPFWGRMGDHAKTKNRVLIAALLLEALVGLLFFAEMPDLWMLLLCVVLFYIPFLAPQMLVDTIVVENLNRVKVRFGMLRCFASFGAALMSFVFGFVGEMTNIKAFSIFALFSAGSIIPLLFIPKTKGHAHGMKQKGSYRSLLQNKRFILFLFYGFALFLCGAMVNAFFPIYFTTEKGLNAGVDVYGIFMGVTILLEASLMFFGSRFFTAMNPYAVFMFPLVAGVFRMLISFFAHSWMDMLIYPAFHALWFAPLWTKVAPFIQSVMPLEMRATGQSVWTIITCGIAPVIGSLLAGGLADWMGIREMFLVVCMMMAVLSAVFALLFIRQARIDRTEGWEMQF